MERSTYKEFEEYNRELDKKYGKTEENSFVDFFRTTEQVRNKTSADIIRYSDVEKSYYYQIMKGNRIPGRDKVLRLCIGAGLTTEETNRALVINENSPLFMKRKRDRVLSYALEKGLSVTETNLLLDEQGERML